MKKILSLALAGVMMFSAMPMAYAVEAGGNWTTGTNVTVVGEGGEYFVTVPASLEPGQVGTVTASGYWASNERLTVTAPSTVEVTDGAQTTNVNVSFVGIKSNGDDLNEMNIPVNISIDSGDIKFGEWNGTIVYNVELKEVTTMSFTIKSTTLGNSTYEAEEGMTWAEWVESNYNDGTYIINYEGRAAREVENGNMFVKCSDTGTNQFCMGTDVINASSSYVL